MSFHHLSMYCLYRNNPPGDFVCMSLLFFSLSFFRIQSTTDDIIIIAYGHHFQTYFFTLTREKDTSSLSCQILLVIEDETYEQREKLIKIKYGSILSRTMISPSLSFFFVSIVYYQLWTSKSFTRCVQWLLF